MTDSLAQSNLKQTLDTFQVTVTRLNALMADLEAGRGVGKLLKDEALYTNVEASTKEIELLIKDLKNIQNDMFTSHYLEKKTAYKEKVTKE